MESINDKNYENKISTGTVLIDFWSETCIPCKNLNPILKQIEKNYNLKIFKVNVNENPGLSSKYFVRGLPTLILMKDYRVLTSIVGFQNYEQLSKKLDKYL